MILVSPRGLNDLFVDFKGLENLYLCSEVFRKMSIARKHKFRELS